jgi:hypothetical protein
MHAHFAGIPHEKLSATDDAAEPFPANFSSILHLRYLTITNRATHRGNNLAGNTLLRRTAQRVQHKSGTRPYSGFV